MSYLVSIAGIGRTCDICFFRNPCWIPQLEVHFVGHEATPDKSARHSHTQILKSTSLIGASTVVSIVLSVVRMKVVALAISAGLAALSGALYAHFFHFLSPDMVGTPRSLELVAMLVIGGEGTLVGPVLGSIVLTLLPTVFQPLALYKTFATGALLVLFFLYLPEGIFGWFAGRLQRRAA